LRSSMENSAPKRSLVLNLTWTTLAERTATKCLNDHDSGSSKSAAGRVDFDASARHQTSAGEPDLPKSMLVSE
jgi:hypothetical protein